MATKTDIAPELLLVDEEWNQRLKMGRQFMRKFVSIDMGACVRFRDPSAEATASLYNNDGETNSDDDGGDLLEETPVGQPNLLTNMEYVKLAAVTIRRPDFLITPKEGAPPEVKTKVRDKYRKLWKKKDWNRRAQMAALKHDMLGLGFVSYRWDTASGEPDYRHIQSWNICIDPCLNDWQNIRWGGWRITVPLREARKLYPQEFPEGQDPTELMSGQLDKKKIKIWILFDKDSEVHLLDKTHDSGNGPGGKVIKRKPNLYGRVPLLVYEGMIDPGPSEFPLGDSMLAAGLQQEYNDTNQIISDTAKHGGPMNLVNVSGLGKGGEEALKSGKPQQFIPCNDLSEHGIPIKRVEAEQLGTATLEANNIARRALQEWVGVTANMLGSPTEGAHFATDIASMQSQSGVRTIQNRSEYEQFLDRWAESCLYMWIAFGGPRREGVSMASTPEQVAEWELLKQVESVAVVESSTMYRDPSADQTASMQLYQMMSNGYELYLTRAQMGLSKNLPNIEMYANDVLRAFGKQNVDEYWQPFEAPQQGPQNKPPSVSINYKDLDPEDQMAAAQAAGLPGRQPGPPQEAGAGAAPENPQLEMAKQDDAQQHDAAMQTMKFAHETRMQQSKQAFDAHIEQQKQNYAAQTKMAEMEHQGRMAEHQAATQQTLAKENNAAKVQQIKAKPATPAKPKAGGSK